MVYKICDGVWREHSCSHWLAQSLSDLKDSLSVNPLAPLSFWLPFGARMVAVAPDTSVSRNKGQWMASSSFIRKAKIYPETRVAFCSQTIGQACVQGHFLLQRSLKKKYLASHIAALNQLGLRQQGRRRKPMYLPLLHLPSQFSM